MAESFLFQKSPRRRFEAPLEARFHSWTPHLIANVAAFGSGFSDAFGVGVNAPTVVANVSLQPTTLPHPILVSADKHGIHLYAADQGRARGQLLLEAGPSTFRASLHRYIGEIQLMLFVPQHKPTSLKGKWTPITRQPMRVARAIVGLARKG
jgi:hypothetical protein